MKVSKLDQSFDEDYVWHVTGEDEQEALNSLDSLYKGKNSVLEYDPYQEGDGYI